MLIFFEASRSSKVCQDPLAHFLKLRTGNNNNNTAVTPLIRHHQTIHERKHRGKNKDKKEPINSAGTAVTRIRPADVIRRLQSGQTLLRRVEELVNRRDGQHFFLYFIVTFLIMLLSCWMIVQLGQLYTGDMTDAFHENPSTSLPQSIIYILLRPVTSTFHPAWLSNQMPFPGSQPNDRHLGHQWTADRHKV